MYTLYGIGYIIYIFGNLQNVSNHKYLWEHHMAIENILGTSD